MSYPVQRPSTGNNQTWCMECDATENLVRKGKGMNCAGDWNMICEACDKKEFGGRNFAASHGDPVLNWTTRPDKSSKHKIYELELKKDDYRLHDITTYIRKDAKLCGTWYENGGGEKYKPNEVNSRWSDKKGVPNWWGGCDDDGNEFIVKWI